MPVNDPLPDGSDERDDHRNGPGSLTYNQSLPDDDIQDDKKDPDTYFNPDQEFKLQEEPDNPQHNTSP